MFKEEKETHPFANISKISKAANPPPRVAREEWEYVHTYEDAMKWHLKWTPWFTKDMLEGILKYAYPSEMLKEGKDQALDFKTSAEKDVPMPPIRRDASLTLTKTISEKPDPIVDIKVTEKTEEKKEKEEEKDEEKRQNRFERFWTLNP